jgi:hypothetical protein
MVLKSMRDNHLHRRGAGISASTLISCPRAVAIAEVYDIYEPVITGWNKGRGSFVHAMLEYDPDPPPWVVRELRLYYTINGFRLTGKPDEVDSKYKMLIDYKSKDNLPKKRDDGHEFQFNIYAFLLRHGFWAETSAKYGITKGDKANIDIEVIAAHYVTWKTKTDLAWKKMRYPVWNDETISNLIIDRVRPLTTWRECGILPECNPYIPAKYWKCDCEKFTEQLAERGIRVGVDGFDNGRSVYGAAAD